MMKEQKGITLVALVITIIVMLILVGVSITVALNGGLFNTAKDAANNTQEARNAELNLSSGKVTVNGEEVELKGKSEYIFINVLEYISFDVTNAHGRSIVTTINKEECGYHDTIKDGDELEIFWE